MFVKTFATPAERRPERAIGEWPGLARIVRALPQLRARPTCVDDKVERPCPSTVGADQRRPLADLQRLDFNAGLDGDSLALGGAKEHAEQGCPMHRQPETTAALRIITYVEYRAACHGIGAMQPLDAATQCEDIVEQPEVGKHGQSGRLQDQPGANGLRFVKALEDGNPMSTARQIERGGKSCRASAGNCDVVRNANPPKTNWPG